MREITVRELRNRGGEVLERVARGEALTVTRDGQPIAQLRPLQRRPIPAAVLVQPRCSKPESRHRPLAGRDVLTEPDCERGRGVLDTNTVILLPRVTDAPSCQASLSFRQ